MNYLIFRTDRIGDFLIISSFINSIKRHKPNSKITLVCSEKNSEFVKKISKIDEVFTINRKSTINKIKLFKQLRCNNYESIITLDKKNSSIIITLFLKSKNKIFNVSKNLQYKIMKFFFKNVFLDNDNADQGMNELLKQNCNCLGFQLIKKDLNFFEENYFEKNFSHSKNFKINNLNYSIIHYDEKWENKSYKKAFKKGDTFTNINVSCDDFKKLLEKLSKKLNETIIVTTGLIETENIDEIKKTSKKISNYIYEIKLTNNNAFLIINDNFFSTSHLISKCRMFISCHGAFTHIASNYNVKILDIIEKNKEKHYKRITSHMENYNSLFRENFKNLSKKIINCS